MRVVVKVGGSLLKGSPPAALLEGVARLRRSSEVIVVHGGGDAVTGVATRLGKEQKFVTSPDGIRSRYTDAETAELYTMVMSGLVAKRIVLALASKGVSAVSVSGLDGGLLAAARKKKLAIVDGRGRKVLIEGGFTGRVESVNAALIEALISAGHVPVISPVALGDGPFPLNVDGDRAASAVSKAVSADVAMFATNVEGLMMDGKLVESLRASEARALLPKVGPGMQKKVIAAAEAVEGGVYEALIFSGFKDDPLTKALAHDRCTVVAH